MSMGTGLAHLGKQTTSIPGVCEWVVGQFSMGMELKGESVTIVRCSWVISVSVEYGRERFETCFMSIVRFHFLLLFKLAL